MRNQKRHTDGKLRGQASWVTDGRFLSKSGEVTEET